MKRIFKSLILILILAISLTGCDFLDGLFSEQYEPPISLSEIPDFDGETAYVAINGNIPFFTEEDMTAESYEEYSELDSLGRCGVVIASIGVDIMPTEDRGDIGSVKPSGWKNKNYGNLIPGGYLYNRCHLIGFQLAGENANERNLITGTYFLNHEGMLPFENQIAAYVKDTENHVLLRVTPIYNGDNLVASGVLMEARSVEDGGRGIEFCIYAYNNQPGITIDYRTGESYLSGDEPQGGGGAESGGDTTGDSTDTDGAKDYILNISSKRFHNPDCSGITDMSAANREEYHGTRAELIEDGYIPCGTCKP